MFPFLARFAQSKSSLLPIILLFPLSLLVLITRRFITKKSHLPPSPPRLPFIGNLHQLGSLPHRSLRTLAQKHGPLMLLQLGQVPTLVVSSARTAQEIMRTHDLVFASRPSLMVSKIMLFGNLDMVFAPYGEHWRQVRKLSVTHLLSSRMVQSFLPVRVDEVRSMVDKITQLSSPIQGPVNMSDMLYSCANNIICRAVSRKISMETGRNELFRELIEENIDIFGRFPVADYFPKLWWRLDVFIGIGARAKRNAKRWDDVLDQVVDAHDAQFSRCKGDGQAANDFVDVLLSLRNDHALTRQQIKALLMDMFAAGTETSYGFLEWSMAELAKKPEVMKKLQEEVRGVASGKDFVQEDELSKMSYLKAVLKEVLRLHPVAPLSVPRESMENCRVEGYEIPSKTRVLVNLFAICRDPEFWEAPDEFRPERFMHSPIDYKGNDFQFIPFGAGRRICPGMNFAISFAELALANLMYRFDWELPDGMTVDDLDMSDHPGFTTRKKQTLHLVAKLRSF